MKKIYNMKKIFDNLANLLKLKSILSLLVVITVCVLTVKEKFDSAAFMGLASAIITYYFTRKEQ